MRTILTTIKSAFTSGRRLNRATPTQMTISQARDQAMAAYVAPSRRPL